MKKLKWLIGIIMFIMLIPIHAMAVETTTNKDTFILYDSGKEEDKDENGVITKHDSIQAKREMNISGTILNSYYNDTYNRFELSLSNLTSSENLYCVERNQYCNESRVYQVWYKIVINGERVDIYSVTQEPGQKKFYEQLIKTYIDYDKAKPIKAPGNNFMGAVLAENYGGLGYGSGGDPGSYAGYTTSQFMVYSDFADWARTKLGLAMPWELTYDWSTNKEYPAFKELSGQAEKYNNLNKIYTGLATDNKYNVTLYYMNCDKAQNMLLVDRGETIRSKRNIIVTKWWDDFSNKYKRRTDVEVELLANGVPTGQTITFGASFNYKTECFSQVKKYDENEQLINYTVREKNVPPGYSEPIIEGNMDTGFMITNKIELVDINVIKEWRDANGNEAIPSSINNIKVELYQNGTLCNTKNVYYYSKYSSDNWKTSFTDLVKYDENNVEYIYTVKEDFNDSGYIATYSKKDDGTLVITNTLKDAINININKIWNDQNNTYGNRPTTITVKLLADGEETGRKITISRDRYYYELWKGTFERLPKYNDEGKEIKYTVEEEPIRNYRATYEGNGTSNVTITNTSELIDISVRKYWITDGGLYPGSITVKLLADGEDTLKRITVLGENKFERLPRYNEEGKEIKYTVEEEPINGYIATYEGNGTPYVEITNESLKRKISISVEKTWNDNDNALGIRPKYIDVKLLADGEFTGRTINLSPTSWKSAFRSLSKYNSEGKEIKYTVEEEPVEGYTPTYEVNGTTITITNNLEEPGEKTEVAVKKIWDDNNNALGIRPSTLTVRLLADDKETNHTLELKESNSWEGKFTKLPKYNDSGEEIKYTIKEENIPKGYISIQRGDSANGFEIVNTCIPSYDGYIEITGTAWLDGESGKTNEINGFLDENDTALKGIKVILKDTNGQPIKSTYTDENGKFTRTDYAITDENGNYTIRVNYDNSQNVYKLYENAGTIKNTIKNAYVEFEYDGMTYTTVKTATTGENTSKAEENESKRFNNGDIIAQRYPSITKDTPTPDKWENTTITASTQNVISFAEYTDKTTENDRMEKIMYCNGRDYQHTNGAGAWNNIITTKSENHSCVGCSTSNPTVEEFGISVGVIKNVNLGLFKREQPDVAIFSDLTKVDVEMNKQKYTYQYGIRSSNLKAEGNLQAQFQNKDTYTYRRPVNPADIAYIQEPSNSNNMSVKVTYEVKVANLSSTLVTTINSISNYFDSRYTLTNASEWSITQENGFNKAIKRNLNITLEPEKESSPIVLTYEISLEAIKDLLNKEATLNNAVEIESYSTLYGEKTVYAEQRTGERTNKQYAGYDYNSHPGDANIKLIDNGDGVERLYSTDKSSNIIPTSELQDDTDIAPSFVLCKDDDPKTLSGIVWEDSKSDKYEKDPKERLGDGYREDSENKVKNVKIELLNPDGSTAKLYNENTKELDKDAVIYTDSDGSYKISGLVTGKEYFIKYTYGDKKEDLEDNTTTISENVINARNYKSTIITDPNIKNILEKENLEDDEKMWPITHNERYSVAVDNMKDRLNIGVLTNSTYKEHINMNAYTKPFIIPLEFTLGNEGQSSDDGKNLYENETKIEKELNKFDFGIIERPRENLTVHKTVSYLKLTLPNGQILLEGDPRSQNLNFTKAIGLNTSGNEIEKRVLIEVDSELMQGAQLEATYAVKVTNNNEIDYDYGIPSDYKNNADGNIAISDENKGYKAGNYYYYGESTGMPNGEMKSTIRFVDYLDKDLVYKEDEDEDTWTKQDSNTLENLNGNGYIEDKVYNELKKGGYNILQTSSQRENGITMKRGESTEASMATSRVLAIRDDNTFYNYAEIIEIDGKTARTIKGKDENGNQIEYTPGNYTPREGPNELDDDSVKIIITPPTGITNYATTYIIAGIIGLIIIVIGIVFIKKKVL